MGADGTSFSDRLSGTGIYLSHPQCPPVLAQFYGEFYGQSGSCYYDLVFGYIVTGIANDSTVAVAPVFWGLLGVGLAVNRMASKENESKIK